MIKIYFKDIKKGKFQNGNEKLEVIFKNGQYEYSWTPKWREELIRLLDEAGNTEAINKPNSDYLNAFAEAAKKTFERVPVGHSYICIGILLEIKGNKLIVTKPGDFIIPSNAYRIGIPKITEQKEFSAGFNSADANKFVGRQAILKIINNIVVEISEDIQITRQIF